MPVLKYYKHLVLVEQWVSFCHQHGKALNGVSLRAEIFCYGKFYCTVQL